MLRCCTCYVRGLNVKIYLENLRSNKENKKHCTLFTEKDKWFRQFIHSFFLSRTSCTGNVVSYRVQSTRRWMQNYPMMHNLVVSQFVHFHLYLFYLFINMKFVKMLTECDRRTYVFFCPNHKIKKSSSGSIFVNTE